ncbi:3-deoxy-D-manno-octulosonic acid kinase [Orrella dioscoreae]|uniref:3-deoxy-D-manno-octulosonic acid kinase n=2 Tax=Orrella dioscoreae TaxID=1851544 RepID=A0A1C3K7S6_9BURK|nr:3-deoxy-D-manno-octulosonic acid kinase [Orrella dioscoreae]SBT27579.1 3-deoxy-D-manno-octulosonic acid kinase [Orrella dioscoreae]SOE48738.1 3-deoxy-D-manno-octulosonic acid kinase [Orrella dioscoreae]
MKAEATAQVAAPAGAQAIRHAWRGGAMLYDPAVITQPDPALFDPATHGEQARPVGAGGRQAAWFLSLPGGTQAALRHYRRGGLVGKLVRATYVWTGESDTRAFAEFRLMAELRDAGLAVPRPLAAGYWRHGLGYRAALLTERIPDAQPLALRLEDALCEPAAQAIADMHAAGAWHADLNLYNILIDRQNQAWLIDFDRGRGGGVDAAARQGNLARLRRSCEKVAGARGVAFWALLARSYEAAWRARQG